MISYNKSLSYPELLKLYGVIIVLQKHVRMLAVEVHKSIS